MSVVCFTGKRDVNLTLDLANRLHSNIEDLINKGYTTYICGGAINSDTWFAKSVLKHKEKYPQIQLHIYVPCLQQDKLWNSAQKEEYKQIISKCDKIVQVSNEDYTNYCMQIRNMKMVDNAKYLLSIYDFSHKGGTASTIKYAEKANNIKEILIIKI